MQVEWFEMNYEKKNILLSQMQFVVVTRVWTRFTNKAFAAEKIQCLLTQPYNLQHKVTCSKSDRHENY
jgi:hypothetical protein